MSPLYSFCTVTPVRRSPSTVEMVRAIWSWCRGLTRREGRAEEIEAEGGLASIVRTPTKSRAP